MNSIWTNEERSYIRENAGKVTDQEGAKTLGAIVGRKISIHAWRKQRQKMGIRKKAGRSVCEVVVAMQPHLVGGSISRGVRDLSGAIAPSKGGEV